MHLMISYSETAESCSHSDSSHRSNTLSLNHDTDYSLYQIRRVADSCLDSSRSAAGSHLDMSTLGIHGHIICTRTNHIDCFWHLMLSDPSSTFHLCRAVCTCHSRFLHRIVHLARLDGGTDSGIRLDDTFICLEIRSVDLHKLGFPKRRIASIPLTPSLVPDIDSIRFLDV